MQPEEPQTPRKVGLRAGGALLLAAAILTPFISIIGRLIPSRENTIIDELPASLLMLAVVGLASAGIARVAYALVAERGRAQLPEPSTTELLERAQRERLKLKD